MISTCALNVRAKTSSMRQPKEIFCYGRNRDGSFQFDEDKIKIPHFYFPDTEVEKAHNLAHGFKKFEKFQETGTMAGFLESLIRHEQKTGKKIETNIIAFRGLMTKILTYHQYMDDGLEINIVKFDGQIFMAADEKSDKIKKQNQKQNNKLTPEMSDKFEYSGYKFETITTLDKPWAQSSRAEIESRDDKVVCNGEQYLVVVRTGIDKLKLLLGGEVDCVYDYKPREQDVELNGKDNPLSHYLELKTSKVISHPLQAINFERKLYRAWAQCFLMGVPKVFYGFRDENFNLSSVETYETEKIPILLKSSPHQRSNNSKAPINCLDSLKWFSAVLDWISKTVTEETEVVDGKLMSLYRLSHSGNSLGIKKLDESEVARINKQEPIVTNEFIKWRMELREKTKDEE